MTSPDVVTEFRSNVRRMVAKEIAPYAARVDDESAFPVEAQRGFRSLGLSGLPFPEALGGGDGDLLLQCIAVEEVSRVCGSSGNVLLTPWVALAPLVQFGSDQLKQRIVPEVASGEFGASFCLTEPSGGSDVMGITTAATRVDGGWRLKGHKRFISCAGWSKWYAVLAKTGEGKHGVFMVCSQDKGVSIGRHERKMGIRGSPTADVIFEDVFVPDASVVGDPTKGYQYMMKTLTMARPLIGAHALGIAQGAFEEAVRYTADRTQFGSKVSRFQMVRGMVADMKTRIESSRALLNHAISLAKQDDGEARAIAAMAKMSCTDTAMSVTTDAVQLHGGYGYLKDFPVERMMRDAKITQIWEGTNQIQRLLVAKYVYGD